MGGLARINLRKQTSPQKKLSTPGYIILYNTNKYKTKYRLEIINQTGHRHGHPISIIVHRL